MNHGNETKLLEKCKFFIALIPLNCNKIMLSCSKPVQNVPIPVIYPAEHNEGLWGGEGVVKGFQKRDPNKRRVPHFWVPVLKRSVVYSEVLDKYMAVVITNRTMNLIHENYGLDHYLLKVRNFGSSETKNIEINFNFRH